MKNRIFRILLIILIIVHVAAPIAEESRTHIGLKRYFCPSLRCSSLEYESTPSLETP